MVTYKYQEVGLPDPTEVAREADPETDVAYWVEGYEGQCMLRKYYKGDKECVLEYHPLARGIWAISIPGTILCPWDADFYRTYYMTDKSVYDILANELEQYYKAAEVIANILFAKSEQEVTQGSSNE